MPLFSSHASQGQHVPPDICFITLYQNPEGHLGPPVLEEGVSGRTKGELWVFVGWQRGVGVCSVSHGCSGTRHLHYLQ